MLKKEISMTQYVFAEMEEKYGFSPDIWLHNQNLSLR